MPEATSFKYTLEGHGTIEITGSPEFVNKVITTLFDALPTVTKLIGELSTKTPGKRAVHTIEAKQVKR